MAKTKKPQLMPRNPVSLRQESRGKLGSNSKAKPKSFLKLDHLESLALWASKESSVPSSLAAFFGTQLASARDSLSLTPDPSLFQCQRCETVLQPGFNCTVRIEKNKLHHRTRRHKKPSNCLQNMVIYKCNFCCHKNQKRGTVKGHVKEICPPQIKSSEKHKTVKPVIQNPCSVEGHSSSNQDEATKIADGNTTEAPSTPLVKSTITLLDAMKRTRKRSTSKKPAEPESVSGNDTTMGGSKKRKKRCWTSLKEIAEISERGRTENSSNLTIPFIL